MNQIYYHKYLKYKHKYLVSMTGGNNNDQDIAKIMNIASRVKILAMSEATHGQQKITEFRMEVFKNLVRECGYTVFVLEDQYSCCELINRYIKTGKGNPIKLLMNLMWFWQSKEMLSLIKWMRRYNKTHNNILEFKGIDIQTTCDNYKNRNDKIPWIIEQKALINDNVDQDNWIEADGFRDKSMYEVFMEFYDKNKKYFLYAHNFHLAKLDVKEGLAKAKWAGYYFSKQFGSDYYVIGNIFTKGTFMETSDLISTGIWYKRVSKSDTFIIINDIPKFAHVNETKLRPGLNIMPKNSPYDAIMYINNEKPIKLVQIY